MLATDHEHTEGDMELLEITSNVLNEIAGHLVWEMGLFSFLKVNRRITADIGLSQHIPLQKGKELQSQPIEFEEKIMQNIVHYSLDRLERRGDDCAECTHFTFIGMTSIFFIPFPMISLWRSLRS